MQIDAHVGGVNDIAFSHPNKQVYIITCGDDKVIKVWAVVLFINFNGITCSLNVKIFLRYGMLPLVPRDTLLKDMKHQSTAFAPISKRISR